MNEIKELAEKILLALLSNPEFAPMDSDSDTAAACWDLAEAMQAQAEQRRAPEPDLDTWQPDWNLAPQGYDWFFKDGDNIAAFTTEKPYIRPDLNAWAVSGSGGFYMAKVDCPVDWRLSLRQRPSSK